jgi:ADP-ribosylation factor GTPase-activating protein 2/3
LQEAQAAVQRGKDGHLVIGGGADDFFRNPNASTRIDATATSSKPAPEPVAAKRFANAKAISSKDFEQSSQDSSHEHQVKIAHFHGATAISSSDYFGDKEPGGSELDLTAADIVNRISFQV